MLSKKYLLTKKDLADFFQARTRFYKGSLVCVRVRLTRRPTTRWAFVVSSKIKKNAVTRNRARRRMAEIARKIQPTFNQGWELAFFLSLHSKTVPSTKELRDDMIYLLQLCGALS